MPNPRLLKLAERWKNPEPPKDRPSSINKPKPKVRLNQQYSFLEDKLAQDIHNYIQSTYPNLPNLENINPGEGSNPFYVITVNDYFRSNKSPTRTASPLDLEQALKSGIELKRHYEDSALTLRNTKNPNKYLAKDLAGQLKATNYPLMIPLKGLTLIKDSKSPHNYSFKLTDETEIIYSDKLKRGNNIKKFNETDEHGLPIFDYQGTRTFYTRDSGLSRVCLGGDLGLDSNVGNVADSNSGGRVVLVSGEAANFS